MRAGRGPRASPAGPPPPERSLMLTAAEASDIARRHGLTIADAASLRALADDKAEAESIAKKFSQSDEERYAAQLFDRDAKGTGRRVVVGGKTTPDQVAADLFRK